MFGSAPGIERHRRESNEMRPERIELSTSGLKDRRSLGLVKSPLTTELRALSLLPPEVCRSQSPNVLAMMLRWISEVPP